MIHTSVYQPRVYPYKGTTPDQQIDRVQDMAASVTLNRTKIEELGRSGLIDWRKSIPGVSLTIRQLEYGTLDFWRMLANTTPGDIKINWSDFETPQVDIAAYETDENDAFKATVWYPNFRLSGFSLNIGDPDALIERTFTLVGENEITFQGGNKYLVQIQDTSCSGAAHTIIIGSGDWTNYPTPVIDPDLSGSTRYILKIVKQTSAGAVSELAASDWTYDPPSKTITIAASVTGDIYKVYYSAATYITGTTVWTDNDTDAAGLKAEWCSIYLSTSNYVYKLQSVGIDITFDRFDVREIGNDEIVARGVRDVTTRVTLGRILDEYTIEEVMRGEVADYGKLDVREFTSDFNLIIKLYSDEKKGTFRLGYKFSDLAPVGVDAGAPLNEYVTRGVTLEGEEGFVTNTEAQLTT